MRKYIYITLILTLHGLTGQAQQRVTVRMTGRPAGELFDAIEKQTGYLIFCGPEVSDSLTVTVDESNAEPLELVRKALQDTEFRASMYQNGIYIIRDRTLITALPESFYKRKPAGDEPAMPLFEREAKAMSETLVYSIGNPNTPSTAYVIMSGTVTGFKTGEPVPGVTLMLDEPFVATVTDAFGFYSIRLPPGRRELTVRGLDLKETKRQLMLYSDGRLDIEAEEQVYMLSEVSVLANRFDNIRSVRGGMERLQMRSVKNIPTAMGEADILRIVMTLPGVKSAGEVSSGFNVRGGATDQNLILYNDGVIYSPTHLFGMFSTFNPDIVDNMELYKSNIPAKYGGRISSVLEINNREGDRKKFRGAASIGLLTSRLTLEAPLFKGKGSFIAGGRTTYSDWLLGIIPEKSGYRNGTASFYDLNGSASYRIDENNAVYLTGYFSRDRFNFSNLDHYAYQNASFSAKWRHIFNPSLTGALVTGYDHYGYATKDTSDVFNAYSLDFEINQMFAKADFSYYPNNDHTVNFGINTMLYRLDRGNYRPTHPESIIREQRLPTETSLESALYLSDEWKISPELMVSAGIRYSMFNVLGPHIYNVYEEGRLPAIETAVRTDSIERGVVKTYHSPEFRLSARYIIDDNTSVKASINTMRQYIHKISNSTVMSPTDTWKLSDVNIRPQSGVQYAAGFFRNFARNSIETSIEAYFKTMDNYLDYRGGAELMMNPHLETEVAGVRGRAYGIELMLRKRQGTVNGWVSYTWSRTMLHRHRELPSSSNTGNWYPADFDKPHEAKLVGNFKLTHRYSFSLNCDYSTGRPVTLPVSKYWLDGRQYVYYSERNRYRIPDYFRMDVSFNIEAGHRLTKLTHSYFNIGVYNVTGRRNVYSAYFVSEAGGRIQGYRLSIFGAPIPYVSYNIKF